jgi:hypothetical protein
MRNKRRDLPPNNRLRDARQRTPSPTGSGLPMSRQELADAINAYLAHHHGQETNLDATYIGKLERGEHRWPNKIYREAFRAVLNAPDNETLGFWIARGVNQQRTMLPSDRATDGLEQVVRFDVPTSTPGERDSTDTREPEPWGYADELTELLPYAVRLVAQQEGGAPLLARAQELIPPARLDPPRRLGAADVARIEETTKAFRDWDNRWGGGLCRAAAIAQLRWVTAAATSARCSSEEVKRRLLTALADLAGVAAFLSYDVKAHSAARVLWTLGLDASREAGNAELLGAILRQLAHQALHLQRPQEALRLVRLAYTTTVDADHPASELALAEIAAYEGWCYAAAGKVQPCHRALGRAQEHFDNADGEPPPPWLSYFNLAELTALQGHAYHVLAYRAPKAATRAETLLRQSVAARPPGFDRSRALNLIALSATFFQRGDQLEEGVAVGGQALDLAATLTSPRSLDRLRALRELTTRQTGVAEVDEFRERIDLVLADA